MGVNIKRAFYMAGAKMKKASPTIMIAAGIAGSVGALVWACVQTRKLDEEVEPIKGEIEDIHDLHDDNPDGVEYTEKEYKKDLSKAYGKMALKTAKLYAGPVILETISLGLIGGSHRIMSNRYAALGAAYTSLDAAFKKYRENVTEKYGKDADMSARYSTTTKTVKELDENGNEKEVEVESIDTNEVDKYSPYAKFFEASCPGWTKDPEYNLAYLRGVQSQMNDQLRIRGHVYLNEVYRAIGLPDTKAGQVVGWIYDPECPNGDNYIDFGIMDVTKPANRDFVNGYDNVILLDFNVDGDILSKL